MNTKVPVLLSYAFRPFFLFNAVFSILVVGAWVFSLHGAGLPFATALWHGHEMLFGFAMAAVAGFSLTAVATWTGRPAVNGFPLAFLLVSWLAGRLVMAFSGGLPVNLVLLLDMLFPVLLTLLLGREIIGARNLRNYPLLVIMSVVILLNALYHLGARQWLPGADRLALYLMIHTIVLLVVIIAGRIVPAFTANWLRQQGKDRLPVNTTWLNRLAVALTVAVALASGFYPSHPVTGALALAAALAHGSRLSRWRGFSTLSNPLLFVLHVAYCWLPAGYALLAFAVFGWMFSPTAALHALTMGAIGSMVLAVTTRVALGHTGRPLHAARLTVLAYWVFMLAALVRVFGPLTGIDYLSLMDLAAAGWVLAYVLFCWVYWPILSRPGIG